ncbi:MAG: DUF4062 domain-containing protein [Planctomycetota bacterium]
MPRVFVSSTYRDLERHREAVTRVLKRMKLEFSAMEFFGSRGDEAEPVCEEEIAACDLFVGIYAWRYGWRPEPGEASITEREFDYAGAQGKARLCYVVEDTHPWPPPQIDSADSDDGKSLASFKGRIDRLVRSRFTTPDDLAGQIAADLARELSESLGATPAADGPHPWATYCRRLADELQRHDECTRNYVALGGNGDGEGAFDLHERFESWLGDPNERMLAILGDYGTGKTTFVRQEALRLAEAWTPGGDTPLPVLLYLRNYRSAATLSDMLAAELRRLGRDMADLGDVGSLAIFLDGLDEQVERFQDQELTRHLFEVHATLPADSRAVMTCRTHFFRDQVAESTLLIEPTPELTALLPEPGEPIPIVYVAPFTQEQQDDYLDLATSDPAEAAQILDTVYDLRDLATRPILLNLITRLLPEIRREEDPVDQPRLYEIAMTSWLERERWRGLEPEAVTRFLEDMALAMAHKSKLEGGVHHRELDQHVRDFFDAKILSVIDLESWSGMVRTSLFLNRDAEGNYGFMHRSFGEYLLARRLRRAFAGRDWGPILDLEASAVSRETTDMAHVRLSVAELEGAWWALGETDSDVAKIAASILADGDVPLPPDPTRFVDAVAKAGRVGHTPLIRVFLRFWRESGLRAGVDPCLAYFEQHVGDASAHRVLETIEALGDRSDVPKLQALRDRIRAAVRELAELERNNVDGAHEYREAAIKTFHEQVEAGRHDDVRPGTVLISGLGASPDLMYGVSPGDVTGVIEALGAKAPGA